ncbi:MAG: hypothetical protein Q9184_007818 [Pyrenodesmia sp. 2 TL-2023]
MAEPQISEAPHQTLDPPAYECPADPTYRNVPIPSLLSFPADAHSGSETKNTYHLGDPSFTYLLSLFQLLTGLAWGIASTTSVSGTVRLTLIFIFIHFLLGSLTVATASYFLVGRLLGPGSKGGRRRRGLFGDVWGGQREGDRMVMGDRESGVEEGLEFGYCFDVAIRAFFPMWIFLYVIQFLLWPAISRDYWYDSPSLPPPSVPLPLFLAPLSEGLADNLRSRISYFLGNTLYLAAFVYYTIIIFLGYNALPILHHTELLLTPTFVYGILWFASLFGFNIPKHIGPLLVLGAR